MLSEEIRIWLFSQLNTFQQTKDQDIWLSDYFSRHAINYTGSLRDVLTFDSDKVHAKWRLRYPYGGPNGQLFNRYSRTI